MGHLSRSLSHFWVLWVVSINSLLTPGFFGYFGMSLMVFLPIMVVWPGGQGPVVCTHESWPFGMSRSISPFGFGWK